MRSTVTGWLLAGVFALGCGVSALAQADTAAEQPCQMRADCDDYARYQKTLRPFLRGSMAAIRAADGAQEQSPHHAYLALKADYHRDPTFVCRQPLTARFLENLWQVAPRAPDCSGAVPFRLRGITTLDQVRWIDPARVQGVHLLFAGASGQSLSRFGHVALRLIVCAPQRVEVGPDCGDDVFEHVVLSFSAGVGDPSISIWKGLFGGYDIRLFATDFYETYQQYTIDEFRTLSSVPLVLNAAERGFLVRALSEAHWRYDNRYRFFSSNCATELQWLLNMALVAAHPDAPAPLARERVRPDRLFADALAQPAFQGAVLADLQMAEGRGHYFPSAEPYYRQAFAVLAGQLPQAARNRIDGPEAWLEAGAEFRAQQLQALLADTSAETTHAVDAFLVLESWGGRRLQRALIGRLAAQDGKRLMADLRSEVIAGAAAVPDASVPADGVPTDNAVPADAGARACLASLFAPDLGATAGAGIPAAGSPLLTTRCSGDRDALTRQLTALAQVAVEAVDGIARYRPTLTELQAIVRNIDNARRYREQIVPFEKQVSFEE